METIKNSLSRTAVILFLLTIFWSASAFAQPNVTSFLGNLTDGSTITINGNSFGANGPNITIFDDFESGTNGANIKIGAGSATIGEWTSVTYLYPTPPTYSNAHSLSGSLAFRGDATKTIATDLNGSGTTAFKMGFTTSDIFVSYWYYFPTTSDWPCLNGTNCNNKLVWVTGSGTSDDDRVIPATSGGNKTTIPNLYMFGNNSIGEPPLSPSLLMSKGKWYRFWVYLHGAGNATDHEELWVSSPSSEADLTATRRLNRTTQIWDSAFNGFNRVMINGFNRWCNDCAESAPTFDDVYLATGPNARARVEIGDAATYTTSKNLSIATVTLWSDTSITATIRQGSFSNLNNAYLYVIDADGNVNENGYPLSDGGGGNTPPPSSGSGGDSSASGGSGCGFVKDNGKGQKAKGEGVSMMILLFLLLFFIIRKKASQYKWRKTSIAKTMLFFIATASVFLLFAGISQAETYYVSPTGTATWANCSGSTPLNGTSACSWQTAMANAVADDIVYFRGGTYDLGTFTNNTGNMRDTKMYPANSGTSGQPITFISYPGEVPNITGTVTATSQQAWFGCGGKDDAENRNYITWDGFSATMKLNTAPGETAIFRVAGDHCTIRNSNFTGVDVGNWHYNVAFVRVETATNALIENNYFRDLTSVSYSAVNTAAVYFHMLSNTTTVRNNTVENCEGGIYGKGNSANVSIYNNFIYNSANTCMLGMYYKRSADTGELQTTRRVYQNVIVGCAAGIKFEDGGQTVTGSLIYNNTIYAGNGTDDGIEIQLSYTNTEVFNNIIHGRNPYLRYYDGTVSYSNYNAFYNTSGNVWNRNYSTDYTTLSSWTAATGFDANSITSDPLFFNAGGANPADYKLQANSLARTSGRGGSYATVMGAYITGNETIGYDPDAPRVEITSPASSTVTTTNTSITLQGTASDTLGIISVTCNNSRGGNCTCTGTTNWTCSNIPLQTGQNIITVTATDGDNKTGIDAITVTVSSGSGDTGGDTSGSGGDSSASGGSGCGFVKDAGKGQKAKGEGLALMVMLIISLAGIALIRRFSSLILSITLILLLASHAHAAVEYGIAANYPGDVGIENAQGFIFRENFEEASINAMAARWEDISNQNLMSFNTEKPSTSAGSKSVFFNGGAHLYRRLLPGYDHLYVRFYVKFDPICSNIHHFVHMGGYNPTTTWPQGGAGIRPAGNERWTTGIEPNGTSWAWDFYSYWMHMRSNPDTNYWGNSFSGRPSPYTVIKNEWISVEFMVKMNSPVTSYNGEQAFWINGEKKVHLGQGFPRGEWIWDGFYPNSSCTPTATCNQNGSPTPCCQDFEGFQWRNTTALNINFLWLLHYVDTDPSCTVKFDDVVVATQYIGPMVASTSGGNTGGNTGGSNGGDSSASGGSGCGFVKDDGKGKEQKGKGEGLSFAIMLIVTLTGIALRRIVVELKMRRAFFALIKGLCFLVVAILLAQIAACGSGGGGDSSNSSNSSSGGSGGGTDNGAATINMVLPQENSVGAALDTYITLQSSAPLNPGTVSTSTFYVTAPGNSLITATVSYQNQAVTIRPQSALQPLTTYSVVCANGVKDTNGLDVPGHTWSFTTTNAAGNPLPLMGLWESQMVTAGNKWGQYLLSPNNSQDAKLASAYYDGENTFYLIADYLKQQEPWASYAKAAEVVYRDNYAISNSYHLPGYWRFPRGIYQDFVRNGNPISANGLVLMRDNPSYSDPDTSQWADQWFYQQVSREIAYAIGANVLAERAGNARTSRMPLYIPMALAHLKEWYTQQFKSPDQTTHFYTPFMFGLTAEALIDYYEWEVEQGHNPDETIPDALKATADYTWTAPVVDQPGKTLWIPDLGGSDGNFNDQGGTGYGGFRYSDRTFTYSDGGTTAPAPGLNLLIAPVYAWLYKHYGDPKYRDQGDLIWKGGVKFGAVDWSGKLFNQNYRMSFNYVKWRQEGLAKWGN